MFAFSEGHRLLSGFSETYTREIFPKLAAKDGRRKEAVRKSLVASGIIALIVLGVSYLVVRQTGEIQFMIIVIFLGVMAILGAISYFQTKIKSDTKDVIVGGVTSFLGWSFSKDVQMPPSLDVYAAHGLLPKRYHRVAFEDEIVGQNAASSFKVVEAKIERKDRDSKGRTRWVTVFRGSLFVMDFPKAFLGRTVVLRDKGWFNSKSKGDMQRIGLVDPVFEKIFEAYGTDQVEGRFLLTPDFMQRLVDLETSLSGKKIRFGFVNNQLLIAVETGNRFEVGSMWKPLTETSRTQKILDEAAAILHITDIIIQPRRKNLYET